MKKFISKVLITTVLVGSLSGLAFADMKESDVNFFLEKIANTSKEKKDYGIKLIKKTMKDGVINVEKLKSAIQIAPGIEDYEQKLKDKNLTLDQALESLNVLGKMDAEQTDKLIKALDRQDLDDIQKVIEEAEAKSDTEENTSTEDDSSISDIEKEDENKELEKEEIKEFKDLDNHWAKKEIEYLYSKGIINGQSQDKFNPDGKITRAQFTALIVRLFELNQKDVFYGMEFKDINANDWYYDSIKVASEYELINGTDKNTFSPNETITREEMVTIIMRAIDSQNIQIENLNNINIDKFDDKGSISTWSTDNINRALNMNIISGKSEKTFDAKGEATRAESAVIIKRVYDLIKK